MEKNTAVKLNEMKLNHLIKIYLFFGVPNVLDLINKNKQ
jgi:hypothetical protein